METSGKILDLLFRRIPPERVLAMLHDQVTGLGQGLGQQSLKDAFMRFAETTLFGYSEDEHRLLYRYFQESCRELAGRSHVEQKDLIFLPIVGFALETLTVKNSEPLCQGPEILRWREVYHLFGQDMIVCAYLAYADVLDGRERINFAWPATLRTDETVLNINLKKGIAENHRHLKGSTQSFDLTWCVLMNKPDQIERLPKDFDTFLQAATVRGPEDNVLSTKKRLILAALVRSILFRALHRENHTTKDRRGYTGSDVFLDEYLNAFSPIGKLRDAISVLQEVYGARVPQPEGGVACLDYAMEPEVFGAVKDSPYRVLSGERYFLYRCFADCFRGSFTEFEQALLHLYLLLKSTFRSELIQVNRQVGFQNFSNYEKRKDVVWDSEPHQWEAHRMAFNAPLRQQSVISLESRYKPAETVEKNITKVVEYDKGKRFADVRCQPLMDPREYLFSPDTDADQFRNDASFFVAHFIKSRDEDLEKGPEWDLRCRHQKLREEIKVQALALGGALSRSAYLCNRVRGIDACSNEVDCRPEVFANAFRFLRNFQPNEFADASRLLSPPQKYLSETYHAGEDFYDITDGLRAIDEAIQFLELRRGDRIGHALAMGVDPDLHYRTKFGDIVIPKQNYLDDLVWLLYRGRELDFQIGAQEFGTMKQKALQLLEEIYGEAIRENHWSVTLDEYYFSMWLRGDAPELYKTKGFCPVSFCGEQYERYCLNQCDGSLASYRRNPIICGLYYYYHYGCREKREGQKVVRVKITPEYIAVVRRAQEAMQFYVERRRIIIECNPTSNVLIGTFGDYSKHPIFRFNNTGLELSEEAYKSCPQLHVCVNTDDLGIFDTSLEFEYALLMQALREQKNEDGSQKYKTIDILKYLQNLQEMGLQAVFPNS